MLQYIGEVTNWFSSWSDQTVEQFWNFASQLVASLAGAYFGAAFAFRLSERGKKKESLEAELEAVNAAIYRCHSAFNAFANLKQQYAVSLKEAYDQERLRVVEHKARVDAGGSVEPLGVSFDFRTLNSLRIDTLKLRACVLDATRVKRRARSMISALADTAETVNQLILDRNRFVEAQRTLQVPDSVRVALVYGLPVDGRRTDTSYGDYVSGILSSTDDCIYFSSTLCKDLGSYGDEVRHKLVKLSDEVSVVTKLDYSTVAPGIMPDLKNYQTWENGFPVPPKHQTFIDRIRQYVGV